MKLRCIGGVHDGETIYVDNYYRRGDFVRVPNRPKLASIEEFDPTDLKTIAVHYDIYKVAAFNFAKDDEHLFLIPERWTDKEAILHQFCK